MLSRPQNFQEVDRYVLFFSSAFIFPASSFFNRFLMQPTKAWRFIQSNLFHYPVSEFILWGTSKGIACLLKCSSIIIFGYKKLFSDHSNHNTQEEQSIFLPKITLLRDKTDLANLKSIIDRLRDVLLNKTINNLISVVELSHGQHLPKNGCKGNANDTADRSEPTNSETVNPIKYL